MIFAFINEHRGELPVAELCRLLGVSTSGFYAWLGRPASRRELRRERLGEKVRHAFEEGRRVYGSPRVHRALVASGERVCRNTVAKLMRQQGIRAKTCRRFRAATTDSAHGHPVAANTLSRRFSADRPDTVWLVDITYIPTDEGFVYLAGVMDLCTRKIVGWSMAGHLRGDLVCDALNTALAARRPGAGLLHHSDRGVQYACGQYRGILAAWGITASMSRVGDPYDNAPVESFWGKLKAELVHHERFATRDEARVAVFDYIEVFYNRQRLHSSLGYVSPQRFEDSLAAAG